MPEDGQIHWRHDLDAFTLIGLDTLIDGAYYGDLSADGFAFLDATLTDLDGRPAVVATHHPWIHSGIRAMDADNLRNGAAMMERLQTHPGSVRMISGHVHRAVTAQIGKVGYQIGPAPCHAVHLDCREETSNDLIMEPGGRDTLPLDGRPTTGPRQQHAARGHLCRTVAFRFLTGESRPCLAAALSRHSLWNGYGSFPPVEQPAERRRAGLGKTDYPRRDIR
ncbi:hypothetical protein [Breoghania sp.]|uniref:hypothetical protein n=1 Tax=Breoghania sp. TaxID=2065378 RepID=UPI0026275C31|nr:hypothetical protein [Breoghania sp.]MDJ0932777.1 hypothetical protein [Breoghania sp.]